MSNGKNNFKIPLLIDSPVSTKIKNLNEYLDNEKTFFNENYKKKVTYNISRNDFEPLRLLGDGSFGKVYLVKKYGSEEYYAMKMLVKRFIVNKNQIEHTLSEKRVLECLRFPFTIQLKYFCMDNSFIYFILPFIQGGEVFNLLRSLGTFPENQARFYAAQVLLGLEYLHHLNLVYRDLKPENLLMDGYGHIKITDFGFCKLVRGRTWTLCGTPDYIAPEIILNKGYSKSVDYWSYGVLIYEMCAGYPPFIAPDVIKLYEKIISGKFKPSPYFTKELKNLVKKILQVDVTRRFGNLKNGTEDIKQHVWFKGMNWLAMVNRELQPPLVPQLSGPADTQYFDNNYSPPIPEDSLEDNYKEFFKEF